VARWVVASNPFFNGGSVRLFLPPLVEVSSAHLTHGFELGWRWVDS